MINKKKGSWSTFGFLKSLLFFVLFISCSSVLNARQVILSEDFEDQDLTQNPSWLGDLDDFLNVNENDNHLLRLNSEEAGKSVLSTNSETVYGSWEFYYRPEVGPSNNNRTFFVLISDSDDFNIIGGDATSTMNGYAVRAGDNSGNRVFKLGRVDNGSFQSEIIVETETVIEQDTGYQIRIERSLEGDWQIFLSEGYGSNPVADSPIVNDNTYNTSNFFGLMVVYSGANLDKFFFDDITITEFQEEPADDPPDLQIEGIDLIHANQLEVEFNLEIKESSVLNDNFIVNNGVGNPSAVSLTEENIVNLSFVEPFNSGEYNLTISDIESTAGEMIDPDTEVSFSVTNSFDTESISVIHSSRILVTLSDPPDPSSLKPEHFSIYQNNELTD
ncbi:MAG: hypothetical protein WDZ38_01010, partial [Balneolaceae bacterium]